MSSSKIVILVAAIVAALAVFGYALSTGVHVCLSTLSGAATTRFPPVDWSDETVETVPAADPVALNAHWKTFQRGMSEAGSVEGFVEIGTLALPTGCLLATDVNFVEDNRPFRRLVPPGRYPAYEFRSSGSIVAAVLIDSEKSPTAWVVADAYGDARTELQKPAGLWGISLDSSAIFVDAVVCEKQSVVNRMPVIQQGAKSLILDKETGANVVCVNLGGVGLHKAYWGLDGESQPVVFMAVVD